MKNFKVSTIVVIAVAIILIIGGLSIIGSYISYNNKEVALRNQYEGQVKNIESVHDKMWKTISQKAQISDKYAASFDTIYTHIISGRYSQGDGTLMKWIKESNPNFDAGVYKDLMQSVEVLRQEFATNQKLAIDIAREHNTLCETFPGSWFIRNLTPINYQVISSTRTKTVMQTHLDDDVNVFEK